MFVIVLVVVLVVAPARATVVPVGVRGGGGSGDGSVEPPASCWMSVGSTPAATGSDGGTGNPPLNPTAMPWWAASARAWYASSASRVASSWYQRPSRRTPIVPRYIASMSSPRIVLCVTSAWAIASTNQRLSCTTDCANA